MTEPPKLSSRAAGAACLAFLSLSSTDALAQGSTNARTAQVLFDEARELVARGNYTAACPKFVESQRLDPAGGTILHAADCHEAEGKIATAWSEFNDALSFAVRDRRIDREKIARERLATLSPKLGKLLLEIDPATRNVDGLTIDIDDSKVGRSAWDVAIPVDKGVHVVVAQAPGYVSFRGEITTEDAHVGRLRVPPLAPVPRPLAMAPVKMVAPPRAAEHPSTGSGQRTLGLVLGGVGLAGLGVGAVFGVRAAMIGDQSEACTMGPSRSGCPKDVVDEQEAARTSGNVSTIAFLAGGALLVGGAVLYLTAPRAGRPALRASPSISGGALYLTGAF